MLLYTGLRPGYLFDSKWAWCCFLQVSYYFKPSSVCPSHIPRTIHPIYFILHRCVAEDAWKCSACNTFIINNVSINSEHLALCCSVGAAAALCSALQTEAELTGPLKPILESGCVKHIRRDIVALRFFLVHSRCHDASTAEILRWQLFDWQLTWADMSLYALHGAYNSQRVPE